MLDRESRIFIAGHRGMVGSALVRRLQASGFKNLVLRTHAEVDLSDQVAVRAFFESQRLDCVLLAAARVGGIWANSTRPAEFIYENLMIQTNVIHHAWRTGVTRLLFLGSSCIYPKFAQQPMKEKALLTGALEPTNEPYAIAKIAGIKLCASYNRQYGTNFMCVMPSNLYGPGDNYDLEGSHVVPALICKMHEAKTRGMNRVSVWGTGDPRRELMYSDDLADACLFLLDHCSAKDVGQFINVGAGEDLSIRDLAALIAEVVGYTGALEFDTSRPDGAPRKLLDVHRLRELGWSAKTPLREGLEMVYRDFLASRGESHA